MAEKKEKGKDPDKTKTDKTQNDSGEVKAKKLPQYIAALSVCMGSVAAGTVLGWTANISVEMEEGKYNKIKISTDQMGWIGSFATLGALAMCIPIGFLCDWVGRKWAMLMLVLPFTAGWLCIIFAGNIYLIYVGRFVTGAAGGSFCVSAPMYTSEIAQTEIRGSLGTYFQLLLTVGIFIAYFLGYIANIKLYTIICAIIPFVFGVCFFLQPETPVHLLKKGKDEMARKSLLRLRGKEYDVDKEIAKIKAELEENKANKRPFKESFKSKAAKKSCMICFALMFFQQMCGINAVIFYTGSIFTAAKVDLNPKIASILVGIVQVIATLTSTIIIEKVGRKILLLLSLSIMACSTALLGLFFSLQERKMISESTAATLGFLPILALCIFIILFSMGMGPIPWMISSELIPAGIKTIASSSAACFNWFLAFIITRFYFNIKQAIGGDITFYLFTGLSALGAVFVLFLVPETKGKSFEQIQKELNGEKNEGTEAAKA